MKMDDDWGYPYFTKPPQTPLLAIFVGTIDENCEKKQFVGIPRFRQTALDKAVELSWSTVQLAGMSLLSWLWKPWWGKKNE